MCNPPPLVQEMPLHSKRGGKGTITWGTFPPGCEGTVAWRCFLYKGGGMCVCVCVCVFALLSTQAQNNKQMLPIFSRTGKEKRPLTEGDASAVGLYLLLSLLHLLEPWNFPIPFCGCP